MRRLVRNIEGEPRPLIVHRRLFWLRYLDRRVRYAGCKVLGLQFRGPRYMAPRRTPEQDAETRLAIESFLRQASAAAGRGPQRFLAQPPPVGVSREEWARAFLEAQSPNPDVRQRGRDALTEMGCAFLDGPPPRQHS